MNPQIIRTLKEYLFSVCWMLMYFDKITVGENIPQAFQLKIVESITKCEDQLINLGVSQKSIKKIVNMCWYVVKEVSYKSLPIPYKKKLQDIVFLIPYS